MNTKRLIQMARKWRKKAALARKRIAASSNPSESTGSMMHACKKRASLCANQRSMPIHDPLAYLDENIFRELFKMSEEEYGVPSEGPITLPCDAACLEYIISLLKSGEAEDVENALLTTIASSHCTSTVPSLIHLGHFQQNQLFYGC